MKVFMKRKKLESIIQKLSEFSTKKEIILFFVKSIILGSITALFLSIQIELVSSWTILYYLIIGAYETFCISYFRKKKFVDISNSKLRDFPDKNEAIVFLILFLVISSPTYTPYIINAVVKHYENDGYFEEMTKSVFDNETDDISKVKAALMWNKKELLPHNTYANSYQILYTNIFLIKRFPPLLCLRPLGNENGKWPLISRYGACGENSLAFMELIKTQNIPVKRIHIAAEDHSFNEVYINGSWIIIDPTLTWRNIEDGYNVFPKYYENKWNLKVSYAFFEYPNGTIEDVTNKYTNTSTVIIKVFDTYNNPVENVSIYVFSNNKHPHRSTNLIATTDLYGISTFTLGDGNYTIELNKDSLFGTKTFELEDGIKKELNVTIKRDAIKNLFRIVFSNGTLNQIIKATCLSFIIIGLIGIYRRLRYI